MKKNLSHLDKKGGIKMVDVGNKPDTVRTATASGEVVMKTETLSLIQSDSLEKGNVITTAKTAGIMGAKRTPDLIPLCHSLVITNIDVDITTDDELPGLRITARVASTGKTGVEMEALTAVSVCALTIYDMAKSVEKTMSIQNIRLVEKHGGQSGDVLNKR